MVPFLRFFCLGTLYVSFIVCVNVIAKDGNVLSVRHLHLSFGDYTDALRVGFSTNKSEWSASLASVCVYWPRVGDVERSSGTIVESSFVRSYNASVWNVNQSLAWDLRFVQLRGLSAGFQYNLQCGLRDAAGRLHLMAEPSRFEFHTSGARWSFVAFGDLGVEGSDDNEGTTAVGYTRKRVEEEVANRSARFVLHYGDLAYAFGRDAMWDSFMDSIEPVASLVPWMISPGNHEIQAPDSGHELGVPMFARFWMPQQCKGNPYWYSFNYGGVHFISLSTEHEFGNGSAQLMFLEDDLKRSSGRHHFIVVVGHRPLLSSHASFGKDHSSVSMEQWKVWQPLFEQFKVDLTLWGHVHGYERAVSGGIPHITSGMAGQSYCCGFWDYNPPAWSVHREDSHGFLRVSVDTEQQPPSMYVEYIRSDDGKVYDYFKVLGRNVSDSDSVSHLPEFEARSSPSRLQSRTLNDGCYEEAETAHKSMPPLVPDGLCPSSEGGIFV